MCEPFWLNRKCGDVGQLQQSLHTIVNAHFISRRADIIDGWDAYVTIIHTALKYSVSMQLEITG